VREAMSSPMMDAPTALRPALAATMDPAQVRVGLERGIGRAIAGLGSLERPTSRWWAVIGFLQTLATIGIALSAAWIVLWILARPATGSIDVPVLGPVPSPFVSMVAFLVAGYLLARLLGAHARWTGSRWAARVSDRVARSVDHEVRAHGFRRLDELEDARRALSTAASSIQVECAEATRV
jgi:hypothetical protein